MPILVPHTASGALEATISARSRARLRICSDIERRRTPTSLTQVDVLRWPSGRRWMFCRFGAGVVREARSNAILPLDYDHGHAHSAVVGTPAWCGTGYLTTLRSPKLTTPGSPKLTTSGSGKVTT